MNKKRLAILMRARLGLPENHVPQHQKLLQPTQSPPQDAPSFAIRNNKINSSGSNNTKRILIQDVKECMNTSIQIPVDKGTTIDENLEDFSKGYLSLSQEERWELLLSLARDYDVNRARVCDLMRHYLSLELPRADDGSTDDEHSGDGEGVLAAFYRMERNLRDALKPMYAVFLERLNAHPGGLKLLTILRADVISYLEKENAPSLRALDSYLKEKLITWLSPAALELHQITWDDSASLLEKIIVYEAVHPIKNLLDLKRRLSEGRRCFGYLHPAIPGEPLIFIEVALLKDIATSIQEVLWESPPIPEFEATCALFYSISSTQPGLSGINLGKFLIKRVVDLLKRDMPHIKTFATLSPIPGFMNWLLSKLVSQIKLANSTTQGPTDLSEKGSKTFQDDVLLPEEEEMICSGYMKWLCSEEASQISDNMSEINEPSSKLLMEDKMTMSSREKIYGRNALKILYDLLTSKEWTKSDSLTESLKSPLLRLSARYLVKEKKRGKALDVVANFHLQNGAVIERINWMADPSEKGIDQSGSIMVNYVYRLDKIDENAQSYLGTGHIHASNEFSQYLEE